MPSLYDEKIGDHFNLIIWKLKYQPPNFCPHTILVDLDKGLDGIFQKNKWPNYPLPLQEHLKSMYMYMQSLTSLLQCVMHLLAIADLTSGFKQTLAIKDH